jgi:hypothetical protein
MTTIDEIMMDLEDTQYWDKQLFRNGSTRLQLRQEWDKARNNEIRDRIIEALIFYRLKSSEEKI